MFMYLLTIDIFIFIFKMTGDLIAKLLSLFPIVIPSLSAVWDSCWGRPACEAEIKTGKESDWGKEIGWPVLSARVLMRDTKRGRAQAKVSEHNG